MVGPQMVGSYRALLGPYGPILGPYGSIWAHMGPARAHASHETISEINPFLNKKKYKPTMYQPTICQHPMLLKKECLFFFTFPALQRPGPGPYGPIWALMFFVKDVKLRVQTAPFDKITTDFWRSRRRLYIPDLLKAKNSNVRLSFFKGVVFSSKVLRFGSRRLRLTK